MVEIEIKGIERESFSMIRVMTKEDYQAWLDLAKEVEPLFGSMVEEEDFQNGIRECIDNSSAFCIINSNNDLEGIVAINRMGNEIAWLAVKEKSRGKGYGYQLVEEGIKHLDNQKPIFVQTFSPNIEMGQMARRVYQKLGFKDFKDGGKNPAGIETIVMKLEKAEA